jgi:hypothetical protein
VKRRPESLRWFRRIADVSFAGSYMKRKLLARIGALEVVTTRYVPPIIRIIPVSPDGTEGPAYILTKEGAVLETEVLECNEKVAGRLHG